MNYTTELPLWELHGLPFKTEEGQTIGFVRSIDAEAGTVTVELNDEGGELVISAGGVLDNGHFDGIRMREPLRPRALDKGVGVDTLDAIDQARAKFGIPPLARLRAYSVASGGTIEPGAPVHEPSFEQTLPRRLVEDIVDRTTDKAPVTFDTDMAPITDMIRRPTIGVSWSEPPAAVKRAIATLKGDLRMPRPGALRPVPKMPDEPVQALVLMSRDNPHGWKLEELLDQLEVELKAKNEKLVGDDSDTAIRVLANNRRIITLLHQCALMQRDSIDALDRLAPDQGPLGRPRIGDGAT
jgi:hypothetical protein